MPNIDPALVEDPSPLVREALRISERPPIHTKESRVLIIYDVALG
jgi:hypothetical protein